MALSEGDVGDVAESYFDYAIEVTELVDGKSEKVHVINNEYLVDLDPKDERFFRMKNLPFDLKVSDYQINAVPTNVLFESPKKGERVIDGFYLEEAPGNVDAERNLAGCVLEVLNKDGQKQTEFLMSARSFHSPTIRFNDQIYHLRIRKELWQIPFEVRLTDFRHEYHPGTSRPKSFESSVVRMDEGREEPVEIQMNEPMRYNGYTYFQASWGPEGAGPDDELFSVFEVVQNPADKWPEYSLWITGIGLFIHFLMMLVRFIISETRKHAKERTA